MGFPDIPKIKSGRARNPMTTNRRNDNLLSADKFLIDNEPKIRHIMPIITELKTKEKFQTSILHRYLPLHQMYLLKALF